MNLELNWANVVNWQTCSIVGKGNHSTNHIQKIKPRVEQVCQELGLQYATEENAGRMYINLQGGPAIMPPLSQPHQSQHHQSQQGYPNQQQQNYGNGQNNGDNQNDELEKLARKFLPRVLRKLDGCCTVM